MVILDSQVHAYERNHPGRPWIGTDGTPAAGGEIVVENFAGVLTGPAESTGRDTVAAMDAAGVDGAVIVSSLGTYGYDPSYALEVRKQYPERFCVVRPVDPARDAVTEDIAEWAAIPGAVGVRLILDPADQGGEADRGGDRVLAAAGRHGLPVNMHCRNQLERMAQIARRHPDTQIVIDHLGLPQGVGGQHLPAAPFAELPRLLALAVYPNVAVKITGVCAMSHVPFPYPDLWGPLARLFDAFSLERCLWGTDWTRVLKVVSYRQAVDAFRLTDRLSESDKVKLMGESLARIYRWRPSQVRH